MHNLPSILFQRHTHLPVMEHSVDSTVDTYLTGASRLAKQVLEPKRSTPMQEQQGHHIGRVHIVHYHMWMPTPPIIIHTRYPRIVTHSRHTAVRETEGPGSALRVIAGLGAAIFGGFAFFKIGESINHIRDAGLELQENDTFQNHLRDWEKELKDHGQENNANMRSLQVIAQKREAIFSRIRGNAILNLIIAVSIAAAAVFIMAGAFLGSYVLLGIGAAKGLIVGAGFLFKLGFASSDKRDQEDAQAIKNAITSLKGNHFYENCRN